MPALAQPPRMTPADFLERPDLIAEVPVRELYARIPGLDPAAPLE